jgi:hypothetical protein
VTSSPPASWTRTLIEGLAQLLDDAGIGTFDPTGAAYSPTTTPPPIYLGGGLPSAPDRAVSLAAYSPVDEPSNAEVTQPVQFLIRATPDVRTLWAFEDAIFDLLHGRGDFTAGGVPIILARRMSAVPLGQDDARRWQASHNYYFRAVRPTESRPY